MKSLEAALRAREAIECFAEKRAQEGRTVPRELLEGLLHQDPAMRLNASQALNDEWLELAPDLPAAENYAGVFMKSLDISPSNRKASLDKSITSTTTKASPTILTPVHNTSDTGASQVAYV